MNAIVEHDVTVHQGHVLEVLPTLDAGSVQCICTSPPYYGLRDYGVDGQLGLEPSPAEYVARMVDVFREARRVLADDGVLWLNIGDTYSSTTKGSGGTAKVTLDGPAKGSSFDPRRVVMDRPEKNLLGIPWRVAFALQDDDSADVYELRVDAPSDVRQAGYLETCRIRTPKKPAPTTASTRASGVQPTESGTRRREPSGARPTETNSAGTAASTTSCTESRRSSAPCGATPSGTGGSGSQPYSTTAANTPSAPAAENGDSHSLRWTTSTEGEANTAENCAQRTSTSGSSCGESATPKDSACCAITATAHGVTTVRARTKTNGLPRLRKADIPPEHLEHFRLVKQDRWILRNSVIWHKPNAMPESVTDRLSTRYEHLFLFSKSRRYWFNLDPIRERAAFPGDGRHLRGARTKGNADRNDNGSPQGGGDGLTRNPGDVWTIPTSPFPGAHFATMPGELARRCILAGCPEGATVLDPFAGSGTTLKVARSLGRKSVGIELNPDYIGIIRDRIGPTPFDFGGAA